MIEPASVRVERKLEALRQELYKIVNKSSQNSMYGNHPFAQHPIENYEVHFIIFLYSKQMRKQQEPSNNWPALAGRPARPGDRTAVSGRAHRSTQLV